MQHPSAYAAEHGDKHALVMGTQRPDPDLSQLEDASNRAAQLLRARGLRTGDHVAVLLVKAALVRGRLGGACGPACTSPR